MNIKEDYVSFEVAKLLKEKGFDEPCQKCYYVSTESIEDVHNGSNTTLSSFFISCPTLQMALKWLREVHELIISIEFQIICPTWKWRIYTKSSNDKHTDFQHYNKYEEAVEAALKYTLENLI